MKNKRILLMFIFSLFSLLVLASCDLLDAKNECVVSFETNCEQKIDDITVSKGSKINEPVLSVIEGKEVDGWYIDYAFTTEWIFSENVVEDSMKLYCKWIDSVTEFEVTFVTNNSQAIDKIKVENGNKISEPTLNAYAGYKFIGWYKESTFENEWNFENDVVASNITLYAKWEKVEYTITFNTNGGSELTSFKVPENTTIDKFAVTTKEGYTFDGWYTDSELTVPFEFNKVITSDVTVYAKWVEVEEEKPEQPEQPEQPGTEETTIAEIIAAADGKYTTTAVIVGVNAQSFLINDGTGIMLVYNGYSWVADVQIGDKVKVTGNTSVYSKAKQFGQGSTYEKVGNETVDHGTVKELTATECDAYAGMSTIAPEYVKVTGKLSVSSGKYFNVAIEGATITGSWTYPSDAAEAQALNGKVIEITGYVTGTAGSDKYLNLLAIEVKEVESTEPEQPEQPEQPGTEEYNLISIADAIAIAQNAGATATTEKYYVKGTITVITNTSFGNMKISDGTNELTLYGTFNADGTISFGSMTEKPEVGDEIIVYGPLMYYNNSVAEIVDGWIVDVKPSETPEQPEIELEPGQEITIAEAIAYAQTLTQTTTDRYIIKATVVAVTKPEYGAMTIKDETGTISVYGSQSADGTIGYAQMTKKPYANYSVVLSCTLQNFNGTAEIHSAWILEFEELAPEYNEADYEVMTIDQARSEEVGTKVKLTGVVAKITYAFGMVPSGFYLVDDTNSIYVYDGQLAPRVKEGDKITICASRANWILEDEQNNAAKFDYTGCLQVESAYLIGDIESGYSFDKSWITETTVKEIMDTPASNNITTTIYKVNALVKKVVGTGFTNYYIDDIDGVTGSYCYTQCSGSDFAWLDQFDGKICTVYLSVINAKSTKSDCLWRFLPIAVEYNNYQFDLENAGQYAITYHAKDQFLSSYTGNPQLELITSVSNTLIGVENVTINYESNATNVVFFEEVDGKVVFNTNECGTAEITIKATHNGITTTETITIEVKENEEVDYITVEEAIATELSQTVTVKGIVGPSLVNKVGFYLMGETAFIAIETTEEVMTTISIGNEVIITGTRYFNSKDGVKGQTCINNASVTANYYGNHEYENSYFTEVTGKEFYNLSLDTDYTTTAFIIRGKVEVVATDFYTSLTFYAEDGTKLTLYNSGAGQYKWLSDFLKGETATLEIAACNWNSKNFFAGCVLSATKDDGSKIYNNLNFTF